jgi:PA14 domain
VTAANRLTVVGEGVLIMRKRHLLFVVLVAGVISLSLGGGVGIAADKTCPLPVKVEVFATCGNTGTGPTPSGVPCLGYTGADGGAPYANLVGTFQSPDIAFFTATGGDWHPFNRNDFGARLSGCLEVRSTGLYTFTTTSDDGSQLYISDGGGQGVILAVNNGGPHPPATVTGPPVLLEEGCHTFEVQFFEGFGGPSGVDLILPAGVRYSCCCKGAVCEEDKKTKH